MAKYHVTWEIDIDARNPTQAARKALEIQREPESIATVFKVFSDKKMHEIDLSELSGGLHHG